MLHSSSVAPGALYGHPSQEDNIHHYIDLYSKNQSVRQMESDVLHYIHHTSYSTHSSFGAVVEAEGLEAEGGFVAFFDGSWRFVRL